jgi:transcriptional regulator with XRE-family HTH domain
MANIREILAKNIKENRKKSGMTQAELAEKADISTTFLAMIELGKKFPSTEVLDRIAAALNIEASALFFTSLSPEIIFEELHTAILTDIKQFVGDTVKELHTAVLTDIKEFVSDTIEELHTAVLTDVREIVSEAIEELHTTVLTRNKGGRQRGNKKSHR